MSRTRPCDCKGAGCSRCGGSMVLPARAELDVEGARALGRLCAARGDDENPYTVLAAEWAGGADETKTYQQAGLDREGHALSPPHVCLGDTSRVCNCCGACAQACMPSLLDVARSVGDRILHRIGLRSRS